MNRFFIHLKYFMQGAFIRDLSSSKKRDKLDEIEKKMLDDIKIKRRKAENDMNEKIAIAEQTMELVDTFIKKLDSDLGAFEVLLRGGGEFEVLGVDPGQEVLDCPILINMIFKIIRTGGDTS